MEHVPQADFLSVVTAQKTPQPEPEKSWSLVDNGERSIAAVEILDAKGFAIAYLGTVAILNDYRGKLGVSTWNEKPGESYVNRTREDVLADARLMLAAPEMVKALRETIEFLGGIHDEIWADDIHDTAKCRICPLKNSLLALTSKAGGLQ